MTKNGKERMNRGVALIALFIVGIFIISIIPLAAADDSANSAAGNGTRPLLGVRNDMKDLRESIKEKRDTLKAQDQTLMAQQQEARKQYDSDKAQFEAAKNNWLQEKAKFNATRGNFTANMLAAAKTFLTSADATMVSHYQQLKVNIAGNVYLNNDTKLQYNGKLDTAIGQLQALQANITAATTKKELQAVADQLKAIMKDVQPKANALYASAQEERISTIIEKAGEIGTRLTNVTAQLAAKGYDTANITAKIQGYDNYLALAKDKQAAAQAKIQEATSATADDARKAALDEAHNLLSESKDAMKNAQDALKGITQEIASQARSKSGVKPGDVMGEKRGQNRQNGTNFTRMPGQGRNRTGNGPRGTESDNQNPPAPQPPEGGQ